MPRRPHTLESYLALGVFVFATFLVIALLAFVFRGLGRL